MASHLHLGALSDDLMLRLQASCSPTRSWSTRSRRARSWPSWPALVGWFMVLRRETFAGHTLSVMAFPGASGARCSGCRRRRLLRLLRRGRARDRRGSPPERDGSRERGVGGDRHGPGVRAGAGVSVSQPLQGVLGGYGEPAVRRLPRNHRRAGADALRSSAASAWRCFAVARRGRCCSPRSTSDVARAGGVPVRALSVAFLLAARAGGRRDGADHRRAARVRAARRRRRRPRSAHRADRALSLAADGGDRLGWSPGSGSGSPTSRPTPPASS